MAEIPKSVLPLVSAPRQEPSDFVTLDITKLALVADHDSASCSSPRVTRSISRKGLLKPIDGDGDAAAFSVNGGSLGSEKSVVPAHVVAADESVLLSCGTTPLSGGVKYRRMGSRRAASPPWLGPRGVLFVFATLSSMGTLILLYFTLSMANMSGGDADAR